MKGTITKTYTREGFMQKSQMIYELTHSYCVVCSVDIHSQLERNDWVSTLFDFCINPSLEDSVKAVY